MALDRRFGGGSINTIIARSFWALMIGGHGPASAAALSELLAGECSPLQFALSWGSQLLFVLKFLDVRWLRLRSNYRVRIAALLAVVALHAGVIEHVVVHDEAIPATWQLLTFSGGLGAAGATLARTPRPREAVRPRRDRRRNRSAIGAVFAAIAGAWLPPRYTLLARASAPLRAPPH
jgi:hypothetical protein